MKETANRYAIALLSVIMVCMMVMPTMADYYSGDGVDATTETKGVYDFSTGAGEDKWAYGKQVDALKPATNDVPNVEFPTLTEYAKIKVDDGTPCAVATSENEDYFAAHRFNFSITESPSDIAKINVTWNGKGWHDKTPPTGNNGSYLYIWNGTSASYEELADNAGVGTDATLTGEVTTSISSYVNAGNVTVLVVQNTAQTKQGDLSHIETDYVRVVVAP